MKDPNGKPIRVRSRRVGVLSDSEDEDAQVEKQVAVHSAPQDAEQEEGKEAVKPEQEDAQSHSSSLNTKFPHAREISETFSSIFKEMQICVFSLIVNGGLLVFFYYLKTGVMVPINVDSVHKFGAVICEILLLIANIITMMAMDNACAAYFGKKIASPKGYSLAICGFQHTSSIMKLGYVNQLSLNSTARKVLGRLAFAWIFAEFLKVLTPVPATALHGTTFRIDEGTVDCIEYGQYKSPVDRGWPNVEVEAGFAELIFGSAIGYLRSEIPVNITTAIMTPQIVGAVEDGDTIVGSGYATNILTSCSCSIGDTQNYFVDMVQVQDSSKAETVAGKILDEYKKLKGAFGVASYIEKQKSQVVMTSFLSGSPICGGKEADLVPVCTTTFSDHKKAEIIVEYMTDGTPASIAAKAANIRYNETHTDLQSLSDGDIEWLYQALKNIHGDQYSYLRLPPNVPGALSPLFWWTTPNLLQSDPALLEAGIETYFAILLRAGMQRTFSIRGNFCTKNVEVGDQAMILMADYGLYVSLFILATQFIVSLLSIAAFIPWFLSYEPIGPAVRVIRENVYFLTLLNGSNAVTGFDELSNAPGFTIWQNMDVVLRVGESANTLEEQIGHITMDKPKTVRSMANGRKYH